MPGVLLLVRSSLVITPDGREPPPPQSSTATPRPPPSSTPTPRWAFFGGSRPAASSTLTPQDVVPFGESHRSAPRSSVNNLRVAARLERLHGDTDILLFTVTVYLCLSDDSMSLRMCFLVVAINPRSGL